VPRCWPVHPIIPSFHTTIAMHAASRHPALSRERGSMRIRADPPFAKKVTCQRSVGAAFQSTEIAEMRAGVGNEESGK
ncbi:hypothetical protein BC938DRAFT_477639, partial [Jimgerdemannia flammicorona]